MFRIVETPFRAARDGFGNRLRDSASHAWGEALIWDDSPAAHAETPEEELALAVEEWRALAADQPEDDPEEEFQGIDHDSVRLAVMGSLDWDDDDEADDDEADDDGRLLTLDYVDLPTDGGDHAPA